MTSIHLYYCAENGTWRAYENSAARLVDLIPNFESGLYEEHIPDSDTRLMCIDIDFDLEECESLPGYCILLGNDYIELYLPAAAFV